ncbi:MAG: hypothetical protein U9N57_01220 [Pseudomonadota bacterium]|nr:hypothetical protein [Pseudomonadota bacterium]
MNTGQGISLSYAGWSLVVGVLLISYTTTDAMLAETLTFNSAVNPFSYSGANQSMTQAQALSKLIDLLYMSFGSWAVFRGILLLRELGHQRMVQNNPKSPLGQAIGFMVFGEAAIHHEEVFLWISDYVPLLQSLTSSFNGAFDVPT